jgi:hypothetical protein
VCVWARQIRQLCLTIPLVVLFVSCALGAFLGGGGPCIPSPGYMQCSTPAIRPRPTGFGAVPQNLFFGRFLLFLADFAIFSGFLN